MHFYWYGKTFFKLEAKPKRKEVTILIDPYESKVGESPRSLKSNIVILTRDEENELITLTGDPFKFTTPGECEKDNVLIKAVDGHKANSSMVRIDTEGISVGHLGMANEELTDRQSSVMNGIDVLCIPVGAKEAYNVDKAMKVINSIEPRVIIPMAFQCDNVPEADPVNNFLKEMGEETLEPEDKTIIKKSKLPQEDTDVIVLDKAK